MSDQLKTSNPATCKDSPSAIGSQALRDGLSRLISQAGRGTGPSGPVVAPVSLSARQAKEAGLLTSGTSGRPGTTSSASAALQSSLENNLRARMPYAGGILYKLTWKTRTTPAGWPICALRAWPLRISASVFTGWPTPQARDHKGADTKGVHDRGGKGPPLNEMARMAGWPTPQHRDGDPRGATPQTAIKRFEQGRRNLDDGAQLAGWPTPTARDGSRGGLPPRPHDTGIPLSQMVAQIETDGPARLTADGRLLTGSDAEMDAGGQLSPHMSAWIMGYPRGWCAQKEMRSG